MQVCTRGSLTLVQSQAVQVQTSNSAPNGQIMSINCKAGAMCKAAQNVWKQEGMTGREGLTVKAWDGIMMPMVVNRKENDDRVRGAPAAIRPSPP